MAMGGWRRWWMVGRWGGGRVVVCVVGVGMVWAGGRWWKVGWLVGEVCVYAVDGRGMGWWLGRRVGVVVVVVVVVVVLAAEVVSWLGDFFVG